MEIERKFLVDSPPDLDGVEADAIEQGYLATGEGGEVRLRRSGGSVELTVKRGSGMSREEDEIELEPEQFETLWPATEGRRLEKRRYRLEHGDLTIELDVYEGELAGLVVAEVEFEDEDRARGFDPPRWFAGEVTGDAAYSNESLAENGRP